MEQLYNTLTLYLAHTHTMATDKLGAKFSVVP